MMLPEMEAIRSSFRKDLLHCMHCISLLKILENVILTHEKDNETDLDIHASSPSFGDQ